MTTSEIRTLKIEAAAAGDQAMVEICDRAIDGDAAALAECERVQAEAAAQDDEEGR